ncbi:helix-turn-helix domain-containing protein [Paraflavitalea pollutisoli]|uniref:helix-turn-helix domain-containing protein n=1 Tax=Paraflavitalea pollutisoli TaxID=3034143 RepID=UPI0023ECD05A|nr:helix-turn-helix transcriptional regulator [Paraflavitalea sp. H1-2-19X]
MLLHIKNMVCNRCILAVRQQLDQLELPYSSVNMGEVELTHPPAPQQLDALRHRLEQLGFELLDDKKSTIVEKIKNIIVQEVHHNAEGPSALKLSALLSDKLGLDYHYLTTLFSSVEGVTIEKYAILQRIERAKELLLYDELSLSQIADQLGYSSVQHLSQQFKKTTGLTPSHFKQLKDNKRKPLDQV